MAGQPAQLDRNRWLALWARLGGQRDGAEIFQQLIGAYTEPSRFYHTAIHINDCLTLLDWARDLAARPDEVEAALWFHDVVYVPGASDNEERSADMASFLLSRAGTLSGVPQRIAGLVRATKHVEAATDPDAQLVCDIDLSVLGREEPEFEQFEERIRQEYAWVPEPTYRKARSEVLIGFLQRPSIYYTERFVRRYEQTARQNLERLLAVLSP